MDSVVDWDATSIRCMACSHRDLQNPLRQPEGLPTICGLEYAAQAIGVHIGLTNWRSQGLTLGYIGSVNMLTLHSLRLDVVNDNLDIDSRKLFEQETRFIYSFTIKAGTAMLLEGRASIFVQDLMRSMNPGF